MLFRKIGLWIALSILMILIVGCGKASTSDKKEESSDTEESVKKGGELRIAVNAQPPTLDPHVSPATVTRDTARPIFETLVTLNSNYEVQPMLAENFEQSEDGLTFTFHLREGVTFHNGKELIAEDVVASLERWVQKATKAKNAIGNGKFEALDDYTVQLTLEETSVGALSVLAATSQFGAIMPKAIVENAPDAGVTEYIGTGPFKFVEWKQDQYIHFEKYEDYQSPEGTPNGLAGKREALVDDLYYDIVSDSSTRVAGVVTGLYDVAIWLPADNLEQLKSTPNLETAIALNSGAGLIFNEKEGQFTNQAMRQAVNMALDFEEILLAGLASPELYRLSPGILFPEQKDWYTDAGSEYYNQNNPELAKEMFKEAGYNGEEIKLLATRDYDFIYNIAIAVQGQLEKIGVKVKVETYDFPTYLSLTKDPTKFDMFVIGYSTQLDPTQHLIFSPEYDGWNEDPKTAELIESIRHSKTPAEAFPYWEELQEHTWKTHLPYIRFGDFYTLISYSDQVVGFTDFEGVVPWNLGKK